MIKRKKEAAPEKETEPAKEEEPAPVPAEEIPEEIPAEAPEAETEEAPEEELYEFDDDDAGTVSDELLEGFNTPGEDGETAFDGSVDIEVKNGDFAFGEEVTLVARVHGAETLSYRLVWEGNDGDDIGWHTIGSGNEYTFTLTRENMNREYRVALFVVD